MGSQLSAISCQLSVNPRCALLRVRGCCCVGFENGDVFHSHSAVGYFAQARVGFVVEIFREILGGGVEDGEGLDLVDHLVVETVDGVLHHVFQIFEIEQQAGLVEFGAREGHTNLVIVAVRVLALALVVAQVVPCRECVFDGNFKHEIQLASAVFYCTFWEPGLEPERHDATMTQAEVTIREATPAESVIILHQRRSMFRDMGEGTVEELDRMAEVASPWLARALAEGSYHHWLALDTTGRVVGGGGVVLCPWPANPKDPCTERAVILNV